MQQLGNTLWSIADQLRGAMDADDFRDYMLSFLFLLYEAAGIAANFIGGWLATRFGITRMLTVGLSTQILGFLLLSALSPEWTAVASVAWVVMAQGICGVAKDLTKTASKSAIKVAEKEARAEDAESRLFRWVAWFTGSKNAMKGLGFFLGGVLLQVAGFSLSLWLMALMLAGLRGIDEDIWKAARVDGIPAWRTYLQIVLPMMKAVMVTTFVLVASGAVRIYDLVVALTDGGPGISSDVPSRYIYQNFSANLGQSLSASTVMLVSMAIVLIPWIRMEFGKKSQA